MRRSAHICEHCGAESGKPRSLPDNRRTFGLITKAFHQWRGDFTPLNAEHLRAHLLVQAGYCNVVPIPIPEDPEARALVREAVEATIKAVIASGAYVFPRISANTIEILWPKSISFAAMDQKAFGPVRDAIQEIIENQIGCTAEELLSTRAA